MATFVLVPGAWLGGWCWQRVLPHMQSAQHRIFTPTLTGLGERVHLASPSINLDIHIQDVVNLFIYEDIWEVTLVGHSYGGMVITGVADKLPERLAHLVYLDAIVPSQGQALFDDWSDRGQQLVYEEARTAGEEWRWPLPPDLEELSSLTGLTATDLSWLREKAVPHPLQTFTQPLPRTNRTSASYLRTYILCTAGRDQFPEYVEHARSAPDWRFRELPTGHWPMLSVPGVLADMLLEIAAG